MRTNELPLDIVEGWIRSYDEDLVKIGFYALPGRDPFPMDLVVDVLRTPSHNHVHCVIEPCLDAMTFEKTDLPMDIVEDLFQNGTSYTRELVVEYCKGRERFEHILRKAVIDPNHEVRREVFTGWGHPDAIPIDVIETGLTDSSDCVRYDALKHCRGRKVPLEAIVKLLDDPCTCIQAEAITTLGKIDTDDPKRFELLQENLRKNKTNEEIMRAALLACDGHPIPMNLLIEYLVNPYPRGIKGAALRACRGRPIPRSIVEDSLKNFDRYVSSSAIYSCLGRADIPINVIQTGLSDASNIVRQQTLELCQTILDKIDPVFVQNGMLSRSDEEKFTYMSLARMMGLSVPVYQTIKPSNPVYKRCRKGVILEASIPSDAHIRGGRWIDDEKCRSSKAVIKKISGSTGELPIGVSLYDPRVAYKEGEIVDIPDFDFSSSLCGPGFHFFCNREQAENFVM